MLGEIESLAANESLSGEVRSPPGTQSGDSYTGAVRISSTMMMRKFGRRLSRPRGRKGWLAAADEVTMAAAPVATPATPAACSKRLRLMFGVLVMGPSFSSYRGLLM